VYAWGDSLPTLFLDGCHYDTIQRDVNRAQDAAAGSAVNLPTGLPAATIMVRGRGAPPTIRITGPHGETAANPNGHTAAKNGPILILPMSGDNTTYIGVKHPSGGRWTITPQPGSAPIVGVAHADGVKPPSIHGSVSGHGHNRTLRYRIMPRPHQSVEFVESGPSVYHVIGRARGVSGEIGFTPAGGQGGARRIVALVSVAGIVQDRLVVAHYRAPSTIPAVPPRLQVVRRGSSVIASWGAAANATGYLVDVHASDGRSVQLRRGSSARAVRLGSVGPDVSVSVSVAGTDGKGLRGRFARRTLRALPGPARVGGLRLTRHGTRVTIAWSTTPRAQTYLVRITFLKRGLLDTATVGTRVIVGGIGRRESVTVRLTGEDAAGRRGPTAIARLR
jgi:hypothetical protein